MSQQQPNPPPPPPPPPPPIDDEETGETGEGKCTLGESSALEGGDKAIQSGEAGLKRNCTPGESRDGGDKDKPEEKPEHPYYIRGVTQELYYPDWPAVPFRY